MEKLKNLANLSIIKCHKIQGYWPYLDAKLNKY